MLKMYYLREAHLAQLKAAIPANINRYIEKSSWLSSFYGHDDWRLESTIEATEDLVLKVPASKQELFDLENTKAVYNSLKGLSISQATDERLWVYLSHVQFWEYMCSRWSVQEQMHRDPKKIRNFICDRYLFMPNRDRALVRNGIARLWWYGYVSYDEAREDPFELTKILLSKLDIAQSLLERTFSRNRTFTRTVLGVLTKLEADEKPFTDREKFRSLMRFVNRLGGVTVLDALNESELREMIMIKIAELAPQ